MDASAGNEKTRLQCPVASPAPSTRGVSTCEQPHLSSGGGDGRSSCHVKQEAADKKLSPVVQDAGAELLSAQVVTASRLLAQVVVEPAAVDAARSLGRAEASAVQAAEPQTSDVTLAAVIAPEPETTKEVCVSLVQRPPVAASHAARPTCPEKSSLNISALPVPGSTGGMEVAIAAAEAIAPTHCTSQETPAPSGFPTAATDSLGRVVVGETIAIPLASQPTEAGCQARSGLAEGSCIRGQVTPMEVADNKAKEFAPVHVECAPPVQTSSPVVGAVHSSAPAFANPPSLAATKAPKAPACSEAAIVPADSAPPTEAGVLAPSGASVVTPQAVVPLAPEALVAHVEPVASGVPKPAPAPAEAALSAVPVVEAPTGISSLPLCSSLPAASIASQIPTHASGNLSTAAPAAPDVPVSAAGNAPDQSTEC